MLYLSSSYEMLWDKRSVVVLLILSLHHFPILFWYVALDGKHHSASSAQKFQSVPLCYLHKPQVLVISQKDFIIIDDRSTKKDWICKAITLPSSRCSC